MIIKKGEKDFITRSDKPNENWTGDDSYIVVDDNSELGKKILAHAPFYEEVFADGELIDIIPTERPQEPKQPPSKIELLEQENKTLGQMVTDLELRLFELEVKSYV